MLSFSLVAEAYQPDPPSPAGVNFFLIENFSKQSSKNSKIQLDLDISTTFQVDFPTNSNI